MADQGKRCWTCGWWVEGRFPIIGECQVEMEGKTGDHICHLNMWKPKEAQEAPVEAEDKPALL